MAEGYQRFLDFDWSHDGWQAYLDGLYPPPNHAQLLKFKKKWYKKNVDADFVDAQEPPSATPRGGAVPDSDAGGAAGPPPAAATPSSFPSPAFADGTKWQVMGKKATICFAAYGVAVVMAIGSFAWVLPPHQALMVLVGAFVLEILAKYGFKFTQEYVQHVIIDDVGVMPIMALTLLMPGPHRVIRVCALTGPFLTAVMSFSQICKNHGVLPVWVREFFSPLAEPAARYKLMQIRGFVEVATGFLLLLGVLTATAAPFSALLYWNFMMMRYMMSHWTQQAFQKIDDVLRPVCDKVPGLRGGYSALKRRLFGFVDPESKRAGQLCAIL